MRNRPFYLLKNVLHDGNSETAGQVLDTISAAVREPCAEGAPAPLAPRCRKSS